MGALDGNDLGAVRGDQYRAAVHFGRVAYRNEDIFDLTAIVDDKIVDLADVVAAERQDMTADDAVRRIIPIRLACAHRVMRTGARKQMVSVAGRAQIVRP
ncbi:MAG TPA: hypothetical protein VIT83_00755 [Gammaproteobacteria bacterium]